jgi:hypothetical protein
LGRSLAFASGGFLLFASGGQFIRTSLGAAKDALVTQRQLGAQFKADGKSLAVYRGQVDATGNRLSLLAGFTKTELAQSLTTILRGTKNVSAALRDEAIAANIARGTHKGLAIVSVAVGKAAAGSTTSLRRLGIQLPKGTTGLQALAIAAQKFAGQAKAGTTEQERFRAVLTNSEIIIGNALLPTLEKYLLSGAKWLTQMNESGRLQKDVTSAVHGVSDAFQAAKAIISPVIGAFRLLGKISGGTENEVKLLGTAFLILEGRAKLIKWGLITTGIEGVGTASVVAAGEVTTLRTRLLGLSKLGPIIIPFALSFIPPNKKGQDALDRAHLGFLGRLPFIGHAEQQVARGGQATHDFLFGPPRQRIPKPSGKFDPATRGFVQSTRTNPSGEVRFDDPKHQAQLILHETFAQAKLLNPRLTRRAFELGQQVARAFVEGTNKPPKVTKARHPSHPLSLAGRFNLAEFRLARAQLTATNLDDRRILVTEAAIVRQQIAATKTLKDRTAKTQQLAGILSQIQGIDQADAQAAKQAAQAARDRAKAAREHAAVLQARQFKVLGLDATGSPLTPGIRGLKKELGSVGDAIKGTFLDTGKTRSLLGNIRKLLSGQLGALSKDVRAKIKELLDGVDQQLKQNEGFTPFKGQVVSTAKLLSGLGLTPDQMRAARGRLSQLGAGGVVPQTGKSGAFGVAVSGGFTVTMHNPVFNGVTDVNAMKNALDKRARQQSPTRRGRNAGR